MSHQLPRGCLERDISNSPRFLDIKRRNEEFLKPKNNEIVDLSQLDYSPNGKFAAGVAPICKELQGAPTTRLVTLEIESGSITTFEEVGKFDIQPKWSPDGKTVSFLSQIGQCCQLHFLDVASGTINKVTDLKGSVEKQSWSQDGAHVLLTVAGLGADKSGADGGVSLVSDKSRTDDDQTWVPAIEAIMEEDSYRTVWIYEAASSSVKQASPDALNFWVAAWGPSNGSIVGICSDLPGEEHWYRSTLREINMADHSVNVVFTTSHQMEALRTSPNGTKAAVITGIASDRQLLRGDMCIVDIASKEHVTAATNGVNVAWLEWAGDDDIVASGTRNDEEVLLHYNVGSGKCAELWQSREYTIGPTFWSDFAVTKGDGMRCLFVRQGWFSPPTVFEVAVTPGPTPTEIRALSSPELHDKVKNLGTCENVNWKAPDGLEIHGYLLTPSTPAPHPTIMFVHGGPVYHWRPRYLGSYGALVLEQSLLAEGFAIFKPNVRGSAGRGQEFSQHVYGDMGGLDTNDFLSGLDALVDSGKANPKRLGVTGGSYGGYMSSWLVTQTDRFAAAVPVAPVTNWVSFQYTTHIAQFSKDFLNDDPHNPQGKFFTRSPLHYVSRVKTPTMTVCGEQDKCTPPGQGVEFHRALVAQGKVSLLLTYPEEGHGVRLMPAVFDYTARVIDWFKHYL